MIQNFETVEATKEAFEKALLPTKVILDVGTGIDPMLYFKAETHIMLEPFGQYVDLLKSRFATDPNVVIIQDAAPEGMMKLPANSVDSVFMMDFIEHVDKQTGSQIIAEAERVARKQIVIFTPYGFMPQSYEAGEKDAWGLDGTELQEHKSGWTPDDFGPGWEALVCDKYHTHPKTGEIFGAFYAIKNIENPYQFAFDHYTLLISSYALPEAAFEQRDDDEKRLTDKLFDSLKLIDPQSYALAGKWDFSPWKKDSIYRIMPLASHRLPVAYFYLPGFLNMAPDAIDFDSITKIGKIPKVIIKYAKNAYQAFLAPRGISKVIYMDKENSGAYACMYLHHKYGITVEFLNTSTSANPDHHGQGLFHEFSRKNDTDLDLLSATDLAKKLIEL